MISEPASPLLGVGSGARAGSGYLFILLMTLTGGPSTIFFRMKHASLKY
jgi:hypothetical protein